jgi:hypothetical protein
MDITNKPTAGEFGYIFPTGEGDTYKNFVCMNANRVKRESGGTKCTVCALFKTDECNVVACNNTTDVNNSDGSIKRCDFIWRKV